MNISSTCLPINPFRCWLDRQYLTAMDLSHRQGEIEYSCGIWRQTGYQYTYRVKWISLSRQKFVNFKLDSGEGETGSTAYLS